MSLPIRLLPEAVAEFDQGTDWYDQQQAGLSRRFVVRVREAIRRVAANPKLHAEVYRDVRRATVTGFPYVVLYREEQGELVVISVFHTSRDPGNWQSRV